MPTVSLLICIAAVWLSQRLLSIWQTMRFRNQLLGLRAAGQVSVGMAKARARRVYVGLAFDDHGVVTANVVLRGVTVFATGRALPALTGCQVADLAAGSTPAGLPALVAKACVQAAEFMTATLARAAAKEGAQAPA